QRVAGAALLDEELAAAVEAAGLGDAAACKRHDRDPGEGERRAPYGSRRDEAPSRHEAGILSSASADGPGQFGAWAAFGYACLNRHLVAAPHLQEALDGSSRRH